MNAGRAVVGCLLGLALALYWGLGGSSKAGRVDAPPVSQAVLPSLPVAPARHAFTASGVEDASMFAGRAVDVEAALGARARAGDPTAAFNIYVKLARCADPMLAGVGEQQRAAYRRMGISSAQVDQKIEALRGECAAADAAVQRRGQWLVLAAEAGNEDAMLRYAADPDAVLAHAGASAPDAGQYGDRSLEYLQRLAGKGRADAMLSLSMAYKNSEYLPRDPVKSAAYRLAAEAVAPIEIAPQPPGLTLKGLTSQQQADAIALARAIRAR